MTQDAARSPTPDATGDRVPGICQAHGGRTPRRMPGRTTGRRPGPDVSGRFSRAGLGVWWLLPPATPFQGDQRAPKAHRLFALVAGDVTDQLARWAPTVAVATAMAAVTVMTARWWLLRRALGRRGPVCQLLPTETFDPSTEEVVRFGGVLARVHRVSRALGARQATAVRIRLSSEDGTLVYRLEGPARARSLLRSPGFAEVEALPIDDADGSTSAEATGRGMPGARVGESGDAA